MPERLEINMAAKKNQPKGTTIEDVVKAFKEGVVVELLDILGNNWFATHPDVEYYGVAKLKQLIGAGRIRVNPEKKYMIIRAWRAKNHSVVFVGRFRSMNEYLSHKENNMDFKEWLQSNMTWFVVGKGDVVI